MSKKILFAIILISPFLFSVTLKTYYLCGTPLRMKGTDQGIFVINSLDGTLIMIHNDNLKKLSGFSFPLWIDTLKNYGYVTDVTSGYVYKINLSTLDILSKVWLKRPEMIQIYNGRIYVSVQNYVYELNTNLIILRKWKFCAKSVYFYFYKNYLLHMNYWKTNNCPDVTIIDLNSGKVIKNLYLGFKRPLRFLSIYDKWIFLDYKTGDVVFMRNFHVTKRFNLPPYSYDIIYYKNKIVVSNLFEKSLYVIDPILYKMSKIRIDCQVGDLETLKDQLFLSCIFDDQVYAISNWKISWKIPCSYPIMIEKSKQGIYILCSDEGKVKFIDLSGKIEEKGGL